MRLRSLKPAQGIWFAWHPVWTTAGKVWLEHIHFKWIEGWGWGSDGHYEYRRMLDQDRYDRGERANADWGIRPLVPCTCPDAMVGHRHACRFNTHPGAQTKFFDYEMASGRVVPPNVSKCGERNTNDPCRYPACTCMNIGGSTRVRRSRSSCRARRTARLYDRRPRRVLRARGQREIRRLPEQSRRAASA